MKIETKFNIGDVVYFLSGRKAGHLYVNSVQYHRFVSEGREVVNITYFDKDYNSALEQDCFGSLKELLEFVKGSEEELF